MLLQSCLDSYCLCCSISFAVSSFFSCSAPDIGWDRMGRMEETWGKGEGKRKLSCLEYEESAYSESDFMPRNGKWAGHAMGRPKNPRRILYCVLLVEKPWKLRGNEY